MEKLKKKIFYCQKYLYNHNNKNKFNLSKINLDY